MTRGPSPKPPELRQRTNKASTAAVLPAGGSGLEPPELPAREDRQAWHPMALAMWADVWASPMAVEFLDADLHGLYVLADLVHLYWQTDPSILYGKADGIGIRRQLAAEIAKQRQAFGLTPIDRWRLHWTIDHGDGRPHGNARPKAPAPPPEPDASDPRKLLRAVE